MHDVTKLVNLLQKQYNEDESPVASEVIQHQLAIALNTAIPLDANAATGLIAFNEHRSKINGILSDINELFVIDLERVRSNARELYVARWNLVFRPQQSLNLLVSLAEHSVGYENEETSAMVKAGIEKLRGGLLIDVSAQMAALLKVE